MRRRAVLTGVAVLALYLGGALVSGRLSPLNRRPLLEGGGGLPPPYHWVKPPPDLAASNKAPTGATKTISFDARGSVAGVFSTPDYQMSVILQGQAVPKEAGTTSATISIEPLDPATLAPLPSGLTANGNAYRVQVHLKPSNKEITDFAFVGQAQMFYPTPPVDQLLWNHVVMHSVDGTTWRELPGNDQPVSQLVLTQGVNKTGYYLVGSKAPAKTPKKGSNPLLIVGIVVGGALVGAAGMFANRRRVERARRKTERIRQMRKARRR